MTKREHIERVLNDYGYSLIENNTTIMQSGKEIGLGVVFIVTNKFGQIEIVQSDINIIEKWIEETLLNDRNT